MRKMKKLICAIGISSLIFTAQTNLVLATQVNTEVTQSTENKADVNSQDTQAQSTETQSTQAQSTQAQSTEAQSTQAQSTETQSTQAQSTETQSTQAQSTEAQSTQAKSTQAQSTQAQDTQAQSTQAQSDDGRMMKSNDSTQETTVSDDTNTTGIFTSQPQLSALDNGSQTAYMLVLGNIADTPNISSVSFSVNNSQISKLEWFDGYKDSLGRYVAVVRMKDFAAAGTYTVTALVQFNSGLKLTAGVTTFQVSSYTDPSKTKGNVMSILGDSISSYSGYTPYDASGNYYDSSMMNIDDTWWNQFMAQESLTLGVNESLGGSRVTWDGTTNDPTYHLGEAYYMASEKRIKNLGSNGTPDLICFYGGMNDILSQGSVVPGQVNNNLEYGKVSDFADAYFTALMQIEFYYPNAEVYCMTSYNTIYTNESLTNNYDDVITNMANKFGYTSIDLRNSGITVNDEEKKDYIHPNESGMDKITNMIEKTLMGDVQGQGIWKKDWKGNLRYFYKDGTMARNVFMSDGTYTYYLQNDGTPMKNRLTYHPDGVHLIYFDENGHELFDRFKFCVDVGYTCYFNTYGYAIFDQVTFYNKKAYYLNATGKMENAGWFKFANDLDIGYANWDGTLITNQFSFDQKNREVFFHWNGMLARGLITDGVWYYDMDKTDGHMLGKFQK